MGGTRKCWHRTDFRAVNWNKQDQDIVCRRPVRYANVCCLASGNTSPCLIHQHSSLWIRQLNRCLFKHTVYVKAKSWKTLQLQYAIYCTIAGCFLGCFKSFCTSGTCQIELKKCKRFHTVIITPIWRTEKGNEY